MIAREYNRRIYIYTKTFSNDGFGGKIASNSFIKMIWAKVSTSAGNKFTSFGIDDFKNPTIFSVRGIKNEIVYTENHFIVYRDKIFYIKGIENKGYEEMEINIYCDEL